MKKHGILNSEISSVISHMGHYDTIAIADCGLPIPESTKRIDIALSMKHPEFIETLKTLLNDFEYEYAILAEEIKDNPEFLEEIYQLIPAKKVRFISHEELKKETKTCKAVIRTGEIIPYANIILASGVIF